uniref:non-specific serine/threonine protein kinase n=3 Tax=Noccaea caerulescens TaxID=107243 RepID=A0A1J3J875_NOCCA
MILSVFIYMFLLNVCRLDCFVAVKDSLTLLSDSHGDTLVSAGERFELGFFTTNGSSDARRYLGIWFHHLHPLTVVWVANREAPVPDRSGILTISIDGNLEVTDAKGKVYWDTGVEPSSVSAAQRSVKLMDNGNLVLMRDEDEANVVWQSFENPSDTFLPGMRMDENMTLSSWRSYNDPSPGNFTFQMDQEEDKQFIIWKRSMRYWKTGISGKFIGSDEMPYAISYFLSNFTETITVHNASVPHLFTSLYTNTRFVMTSSGQAQYLRLGGEGFWAQIWADPIDQCSVYNACGNFGSCNSKNEEKCKCLPGFKPNFLEKWVKGDFSGGCSRESRICGKDGAVLGGMFLNLSVVEVGSPDSHFDAHNEKECREECLNNCQCQAYSFEQVDTKCWIWLEDLNNLKEGYLGSRNIFIRVAVPDIESTSRDCVTCGTNIIPYPLSTAPGCGDSNYLSFNCNMSTGQVVFKESNSLYNVTSINPDTHRFLLKIKDVVVNCTSENQMSRISELNLSSPFHLTGQCNADMVTGGTEVEIRWDPPVEPTCSLSVDCKDWPNSSCSKSADGKKQCFCNHDFKWDGFNLNCTQGARGRYEEAKTPVALIIVLTFTSAAILVVLSSTASYVYLQRRKVRKELGSMPRGVNLCDSERHIKDLIDSGRFNQDDTQGIDVPSFELETILFATSNFSNANKLGQGGFGPVYKGMFPGDQEIAVKRLSRCSGQGLEEFKNEVVLIAKLQHRNLVRLLGYCVAGEEKLLLYEYMPHKSLDFFIFDRKLCQRLDWKMRCNIILGIARGLLYLHQDSRLRIIHRDLKTSNILLDEEMNPKISDFGLARIFGGNETSANTNRVVGTYGYMSPEYALDGLFSFKSDVFSFGVVVIETISGKRNTGFSEPEKSLSLLGYAWDLWKAERGIELLDEALQETCETEEFFKCLNIGLLCVQEDPNDRPAMSNVVFMLGSSDIATLPNPKQPAFILRRCPSSSKASSSTKPDTCSQNELTITLEDGR